MRRPASPTRHAGETKAHVAEVVLVVGLVVGLVVMLVVMLVVGLAVVLAVVPASSTSRADTTGSS